eukprot:TRINITY_DN9695_c0_g1_i2.p1 TRINITY_DN9695_c0_g1~~TRINITY_DN9695_c0_g1_i2.p1  ORF type:complete len:1319 (+),score=400.95 TRINITY_DN9695_c0_g1_i2:63-4019(+)
MAAVSRAELVCGAEVEVHGLLKQTELNGEWGTLAEFRELGDGSAGAVVLFDDPFGDMLLPTIRLRPVPLVVGCTVEGKEGEFEGVEGIVKGIDNGTGTATVNFGAGTKELKYEQLRPVRSDTYSRAPVPDDAPSAAQARPSLGTPPPVQHQDPEPAVTPPEEQIAPAVAAEEAAPAAAEDEKVPADSSGEEGGGEESPAEEEAPTGPSPEEIQTIEAETSARQDVGGAEGAARDSELRAFAERCAATVREQLQALQEEEGTGRTSLQEDAERLLTDTASWETSERSGLLEEDRRRDKELAVQLSLIEQRRKDQQRQWREQADRPAREDQSKDKDQGDRERLTRERQADRERRLQQRMERRQAGMHRGKVLRGSVTERRDKMDVGEQASEYFKTDGNPAGVLGDLVEISAGWWAATQQTWDGALPENTRRMLSVLTAAEETARESALSGLQKYIVEALRCADRHATWANLQRMRGRGRPRHPADRSSAVAMARQKVADVTELAQVVAEYRDELRRLRTDAQDALSAVGAEEGGIDDGFARRPLEVSDDVAAGLAPFRELDSKGKARKRFAEDCRPPDGVADVAVQVADMLGKLEAGIAATLDQGAPPGEGVLLAESMPTEALDAVESLRLDHSDLTALHEDYARAINASCVESCRQLRKALDLALWAAGDGDTALSREKGRVQQYGQAAVPDVDGLPPLLEACAAASKAVTEGAVLIDYSVGDYQELERQRRALCSSMDAVRNTERLYLQSAELYPEVVQHVPDGLRMSIDVGLALPEYRYEEFVVDHTLTGQLRMAGEGKRDIVCAKLDSVEGTLDGLYVLKQQPTWEGEAGATRFLHGCKTLHCIPDGVLQPEGVMAKTDEQGQRETYLVYKHVQDGSFADRLQRYREDGEAFAKIAPTFVALLRALAKAHAAALPHGDLKPANILLRGDEVVLTDFDLAQPATEAPAGQEEDAAALSSSGPRPGRGAAAVAPPPGSAHSPRGWQDRLRSSALKGDVGFAAFAPPEAITAPEYRRSVQADVFAAGLMVLDAIGGELHGDGALAMPEGSDELAAKIGGLVKRMLSTAPSGRPSAASAWREMAAAVLPAEALAQSTEQLREVQRDEESLQPAHWSIPRAARSVYTRALELDEADVRERFGALVVSPLTSVASVLRNESPQLWATYAARRREVVAEAGADGGTTPGIQAPMASAAFPGDTWLLYFTALTPREGTLAAQYGLCPKASPTGPFGEALVFASSVEHCDLDASTPERVLLLCRVALGNVHVVPGDTAPGLPSPPEGSHSVRSNDGKRFAVYDAAQVYVEYVVTCETLMETMVSD